MKKRLCFNCASGEYRANACPSKKSCSKCEGRHQTSIYNVQAQTAFTTKVNREGTFPIVTVRVNGIKTRALIDSGSGGSYMSAFQVMRSTRQIPSDDFDLLLAKYPLHKVLRIQTYLRRFRTGKGGPITTEESERELTWWIQRAQERDRNESPHEATAASLNLQPNSEGVLVCRGRIQGKQPIYIPYRSGLARCIVQRRHLQTLHGGGSLTMAAAREDYWIPRLRSLVKAVRKDCNSCRRFQAVPHASASTW